MKKITTIYRRSNIDESKHNIKALVKNKDGKTLISTGHNDEYIYPRSSIKIFQAIPFVLSNSINKFKFNSKIIALSSSSHRGELYHIRELNNWINKIKINNSILQCGSHYPLNNKANELLLRSNAQINQLYNNCAGKHLAMISSCLMHNYNLSIYLEFDHPHQINIRKIFEKFSEKNKQKKLWY